MLYKNNNLSLKTFLKLVVIWYSGLLKNWLLVQPVSRAWCRKLLCDGTSSIETTSFHSEATNSWLPDDINMCHEFQLYRLVVVMIIQLYFFVILLWTIVELDCTDPLGGDHHAAIYPTKPFTFYYSRFLNHSIISKHRFKNILTPSMKVLYTKWNEGISCTCMMMWHIRSGDVATQPKVGFSVGYGVSQVTTQVQINFLFIWSPW